MQKKKKKKNESRTKTRVILWAVRELGNKTLGSIYWKVWRLRKFFSVYQTNSLFFNNYIQPFRCHTSFMVPSLKKTPILLCQQCDIMPQRKIFKHAPFRTTQLCAICGRFNGGMRNQKAYLCQRHAGLSNPQTAKCWACKNTIFLQNKMMYKELELCMLCGHSQRCVMIGWRWVIMADGFGLITYTYWII